MANFNYIYLYLIIMFFLIGVAVLSVRYNFTLRKYLKEFKDVSKRVSNKELDIRLYPSTKGELGELTKNFNSMIENLEGMFKEVENKQLQLISILQSISHGVIAIDINENIMLINDVAKRMIKVDYESTSLEGKNVKNVIREETILNAILNLMYSRRSRVIKTKNKEDLVYKIKKDPIYLLNLKDVMIGSIINIEDITEIEKLENMRSDFVANVSHELKTPLTSISGFVETLKSNENIDIETRNRFLSIIENESNRLTRLIDDILFISFLEHTEGFAVESVMVYEVYKEVFEIIDYSAKIKNIEVLLECENKDLVIKSNRDYLKQVFINLIDNAIKYTQNEGKVFVKITEDENHLSIIVKDNGVGISKSDIERIFERFYRADKARSREVGGTGLGLAIVKHIAKSLNGNVLVKSELKSGSEFIFTVPKKIKKIKK